MKKMMTQSLWLFNCVGNLNISVSLLHKAGTEDHAYIYIPPIENKTTNTTNQLISVSGVIYLGGFLAVLLLSLILITQRTGFPSEVKLGFQVLGSWETLCSPLKKLCTDAHSKWSVMLTLWAHQLTDVATYLPVGSHSTSVAIKCSAWFMQTTSEVS